MNRSFMKYLSVAALAAGMAFGQTSTAPAPAHRGRGMMRHRMAQALNLTDAQKQQAKTVFEQAKQNAQPVAQQLKTNREALAAAVKANNTGEIERLSAQQGMLRGQMLAIRSEAMAKVYTNLTADQKAKADQMHQKRHERMQQFRQNHQNPKSNG